MRTTYIVIIILFLVSCSSLKNQEATELKEVKAVLLTHLQTKFELNAKRKTGLKKDFIYFKIYPQTTFSKSNMSSIRSQNFPKDTTVFDTFFDKKAITHYQSQKSIIDAESIEKELISSIFKSERVRKRNQGRLVQLVERHTYYVSVPVFTENGNYAIVSANSLGGPLHYSIYKKEKGVWIMYKYFLLGLG